VPLYYSIDSGFLTIVFLTGLEEAMVFLEEAFPVAHGKVTLFSFKTVTLFSCKEDNHIIIP